MTAFEGLEEDLKDTRRPLYQEGLNMNASGKRKEDGRLLVSNSEIDIAKLKLVDELLHINCNQPYRDRRRFVERQGYSQYVFARDPECQVDT